MIPLDPVETYNGPLVVDAERPGRVWRKQKVQRPVEVDPWGSAQPGGEYVACRC